MQHKLRRARMRRGVTIEELHGLSGVAASTISRIEARKGEPTVKTVKALAEALDVPYEAIIEGEEIDHVITLRPGDVVPEGVGVMTFVVSK